MVENMSFGSLFAASARPVFCALSLLLASAAPLRADSSVVSSSESAFLAGVNGGGVVKLSFTGSVSLTAPVVVDHDVTLDATGNTVAISGGNARRVFVVNPGATLTLIGVGVVGGRVNGTNLASGVINDTAGAGIYNNGGTVRLINSTLSDHSVTGADRAAGASGDNGAPGGTARGAAVFNNGGILFASNTVFQNNTATGGVGGVGGVGRVGANGGNAGNGGTGGVGEGAAIFSVGGTVVIQDSTFTSNRVAGALGGAGGVGVGTLGNNGIVGEAGVGKGGAIYAEGAYLSVTGSSFVGNQATGAAGLNGANGLRNLDGETGGHGGHGLGGGIYNFSGSLFMTNSTLALNNVTGANGGNGGAGGPNTFGGSGGNGGAGGNADGGAVYNTFGGNITMVNCTIADNTSSKGVGGSGGASGGLRGDAGNAGSLGQARGAGLFNESGTVIVINTILANSASGGNVSGFITDWGANLSTDATFLASASGSRVNVNPSLFGLSTNGGPTLTMALASNSPAINAALSQYLLPTDQRGSNRVGLGDIGAFEFIPVPVAPTNLLVRINPDPGKTVTLIWPVTAVAFKVQSSATLLAASWVDVTNVPILFRGNNVLTLGGTNSGRFFRLITK